MADAGSGEKTEEPTPERMRKLREDGNVAKSQDMTSAVKFVCVFGAIMALFQYASQTMIDHFFLALRLSQGHAIGDPQTYYALLLDGLVALAMTTGPILAVDVITGVAVTIGQIGFIFSTKPITPEFNKINPINGFKNLFSMKKVVELLKTIVKFLVICYFSYIALKAHLHDIILIVRSDIFLGLKIVGSIIWNFIVKISVVFMLIGAVDLFYQRKRYIKDNKMTKYDVKQEYKQSEGDPQHKSERRRMHQEILNSGGGRAVKGADVVVRNPDHIAVALKYDKEKEGAPEIVAKGERIWAEKILEAAEKYGVPVVRNVPLAQALNKLNIGDEIPEDLYQAVAEVLNFVYALSEEQKQKKKKTT